MSAEAERDNTIVIRPQKSWLRIGLKELWTYRELAYFFMWRDIKVRYKQTMVGAAWAIFQPLIAMFIFTFFFGRFAKMPSDGIPYAIFVYVGLLLWNYFSYGLTHASNSMVNNSSIIQKIYFPRLIIPISSSLVGLVDFCIASTILIGMMAYYRYVPSLTGILYIPLLLLITFMTSLGLGCFLASVNVKYRDVRYVIPFFIQMLLFLTPVIYPVSILGDRFKWVLAINPMSGVIEAARGAILGIRPVDWQLLSISIVVSLALFIFGIVYFRKTEKYFADII
ncbi:MAG: ABC transporter permease [Candidatus Omnitrophica bacterium]|nr:ABC transporter permease [Candidatus Omnitrophota bacterium]